MSKATYWQKGDNLDYKNDTTKAIEAGTIIPLLSRVGVAGMVIPSKGEGTVHVTGTFWMPKKDTDAFEMGEPVFFITADGAVTKTAEGNIPAGYAAGPADAAAAEALVKLLG